VAAKPENPFVAAAKLLVSSEALLICAGAGMGVDSGLPAFRDDEGFWKSSPAAKNLGLQFEKLANPSCFERDPELAWGFFGHRFNLCRSTPPHAGYDILLDWAAGMAQGCFVFTSNEDGHFQKAGFPEERCVECRGSLMFAQCLKPCCAASWPLPNETCIKVDETSLRASGELPRCVSCHGLSRPNVLMFDDTRWVDGRNSAQQIRFQLWLRGLARGKLAVLELGADTAAPSVRQMAERVSQAAGTPLVRVNLREPEGSSSCISLQCGALEALRQIDAELKKQKGRA
jgi:NAD-dependent SIR2 family protein deacetylase